MDLEIISRQDRALTKELAYLLGVYLTDGSITEKNFQLQAIDEDFVSLSLSCLRKIVPTSMARLRKRTDKGSWNKQDRYVIKVGIGDYAEWFQQQTNKKHHLPFCIWDANIGLKKWLIAGIMDGDGWISKTERKDVPGTFQYRIGVGGVEEGWIHEFRELLNSFNIRCGKVERLLTKNGKWFCRFSIRPKDFFDNELFFTISRKQKRCTIASTTAR
jgi:intein/homing endonuclease